MPGPFARTTAAPPAGLYTARDGHSPPTMSPFSLIPCPNNEPPTPGSNLVSVDTEYLIGMVPPETLLHPIASPLALTSFNELQHSVVPSTFPTTLVPIPGMNTTAMLLPPSSPTITPLSLIANAR